MRRRYVMRQGRLVELDLETPRPPSAAPYVRGDIASYRSMRTGEVITGRAQHREHLARFDLIEVGNERAAFTSPLLPTIAPGEIAQEVKRQLARDPGERRHEAHQVLRQAGYQGPQIERILKPD